MIINAGVLFPDIWLQARLASTLKATTLSQFRILISTDRCGASQEPGRWKICHYALVHLSILGSGQPGTQHARSMSPSGMRLELRDGKRS